MINPASDNLALQSVLSHKAGAKKEHQYFYLHLQPVGRDETRDFRLPLPKFRFGAPCAALFQHNWVKETCMELGSQIRESAIETRLWHVVRTERAE